MDWILEDTRELLLVLILFAVMIMAGGYGEKNVYLLKRCVPKKGGVKTLDGWVFFKILHTYKRC